MIRIVGILKRRIVKWKQEHQYRTLSFAMDMKIHDKLKE